MPTEPTDTTTLIAELRREQAKWNTVAYGAGLLLTRAADALEALQAELTETRRIGADGWSKATQHVAERDALQAKIDRALDFPPGDIAYDGGTLGMRMRRILSEPTTKGES